MPQSNAQSIVKNFTSTEGVPKNNPEKNTLKKLHEVEDVREIIQYTSKESKYLKICQVAASKS